MQLQNFLPRNKEVPAQKYKIKVHLGDQFLFAFLSD